MRRKFGHNHRPADLYRIGHAASGHLARTGPVIHRAAYNIKFSASSRATFDAGCHDSYCAILNAVYRDDRRMGQLQSRSRATREDRFARRANLYIIRLIPQSMNRGVRLGNGFGNRCLANGATMLASPSTNIFLSPVVPTFPRRPD